MMKYRSKLPLILTLFSGAIGKEYVIKNSRWGKIKTKFPDMTRIIPSAQQRKCRDLFKEAVAYAKLVIADAEKKKAWQKKLRRRNGVYNEAVKFYMKKEKLSRERETLLTNMLIRKAMQVPVGAVEDVQQHESPGTIDTIVPGSSTGLHIGIDAIHGPGENGIKPLLRVKIFL